jgi:hypothetical protein
LTNAADVIFGSAILLPPLLIIGIILLVVSVRVNHVFLFSSLFTLDSKKSLAHQPLLWFSLGLPFSYFFSFGVIVWAQSELNLSAEGFDNFLKISTLPLLLLSMALPFSLLVWRFHATLQTAEQIALASYKNNIDTYYAHKKALIDHFSSIPNRTYEGKIEAIFTLHPRLHLKFFINTPPSQGIPDINEAVFEKAITLLRRAQQSIYIVLTTDDAKHRIHHYVIACDELYELGHLLVLEPIYGQLRQVSVRRKYPEVLHASKDGRVCFTPLGETTRELIGAYRYCRSFLRLLCEFAGAEIRFFELSGRYDFIDKGQYFVPKNEERRPENFLATIEPYVYSSNEFIESRPVVQSSASKK